LSQTLDFNFFLISPRHLNRVMPIVSTTKIGLSSRVKLVNLRQSTRRGWTHIVHYTSVDRNVVTPINSSCCGFVVGLARTCSTIVLQQLIRFRLTASRAGAAAELFVHHITSTFSISITFHLPCSDLKNQWQTSVVNSCWRVEQLARYSDSAFRCTSLDSPGGASGRLGCPIRWSSRHITNV